MLSHKELVRKGEKIKLIKPKFGFGKYKNKTVDWVFKNDPAYIVWMWRNVSKSYHPRGVDEALYNRCLGIVGEYKRRGRGYHSDFHDDADPDVVDPYLEQWARGIADE